jgi:VIT1/CCC1 family predicted Fe2+/Mn2+ transporter
MDTHQEPHTADSGSNATLNWLRAAVLGANDGVVSVASIIFGVAGASNSAGFIFTAGLAGLVAGALSMAVGEYVSVSTQRDTERALLAKERYELEHMPEQELAELTELYQKKGLSAATASQVAKELTAHDAFAAHAEAELGIDPDDLTNPWQAALASGASFISGAVIPLLVIMLPLGTLRLPVTFVAVLVVLIIAGILSAYAGGANKVTAVVRVVLGGVVAMAITYGIGKAFGVVGI